MPAVGGIVRFIDGDEDFDSYAYPDTAPRRARDAPCCCIFVVGLVCLALLTAGIEKKGDYGRFEGLTDYNGKFCGYDESVTAKPVLYFCKNLTTGKIDEGDRMCIEKCPENDQKHMFCPSSPGASQESYAAINYAGVFCMPKDPILRRQLAKRYVEDSTVVIFMLGIAFARAWPSILLAMLTTVVLAFLYMCLVSRCKKALVLCGIYSVVVFTLIFGIYLIGVALTGGADRIVDSGDEDISFVVGLAAIIAAFTILMVALRVGKGINASIACIKAGSECIWDSPSLAFEPFLNLVVRIAVISFLVANVIDLLSWLERTQTKVDGKVYSHWKMQYSWAKLVYLTFYGLMSIWIVEVYNGMSYFATSYATQLWFFAPYEEELVSKEAPRFASCKGYSVAAFYYMGTLAYGSFCIALFRVPRMLLSVIFYNADEEDDAKKNPIATCMWRACSCCYNGYTGFLRYQSKLAYMDVVLNGSSYCKGGYFTINTMDASDIKFFNRSGASWLVQFIGQCLVAAHGGFLTYSLCRSHYFLGKLGLSPDEFIPRPSLIALMSAMICWAVAHPFLCLPGHVADNILFCFAVERKRLFANPFKTAAEETSGMFARLTTCTGRDRVQEHQAGSTRAQPPATKALLKEAKQDMSWFG